MTAETFDPALRTAEKLVARRCFADALVVLGGVRVAPSPDRLHSVRVLECGAAALAGLGASDAAAGIRSRAVRLRNAA
jgi:hypothetical protein